MEGEEKKELREGRRGPKRVRIVRRKPLVPGRNHGGAKSAQERRVGTRRVSPIFLKTLP